MDLRLFASTFVLIFLAELGDKTQLATLAQAAGEEAPWSVFCGAVLALAASTAVAVVCGAALQRVVPPQLIKAAAGVLFLACGALLLASAVRAKAAAPEVAGILQAAPGGLVASLALDRALAFEEAAAAHYRRMLQAESDEDLRKVWDWLAREETRHVGQVRALCRRKPAGVEPTLREILVPELSADVVDKAAERLQEAVRHERTTADFYDALAGAAHLPSMANVLHALAADEREHAARLAAMTRRL